MAHLRLIGTAVIGMHHQVYFWVFRCVYERLLVCIYDTS